MSDQDGLNIPPYLPIVYYFIYTFDSLSHLKSILICDVQWGYRVYSCNRWKRQTTSYQYSILFINLFKHHCNFRTVSSCQKEDIFFTGDCNNLSLPSPKPRQPLIYIDFSVKDISYEWSHIICGFLWLVSFTYHVFKVHLYCGIYQVTHSSLWFQFYG